MPLSEAAASVAETERERKREIETENSPDRCIMSCTSNIFQGKAVAKIENPN